MLVKSTNLFEFINVYNLFSFTSSVVLRVSARKLQVIPNFVTIQKNNKVLPSKSGRDIAYADRLKKEIDKRGGIAI